MIGLLLIATGTGGIKPCVAAFGGDQVTNFAFLEQVYPCNVIALSLSDIYVVMLTLLVDLR